MKRTIEISWADDGEIDKVRQDTNGKVDEAIGYLATWALASPAYQHVRIWVGVRDFELSASYTREPHEPGKVQQHFLLVGIWRADEKKYSFHS